MNRTPRSILGLTLGDGAIHFAELRRVRGRMKTIRHSRLDAPDPLTLDDPEALGRSIAEHLSQHGYRCWRAAVGLPAGWLLARHRSVPHAADEQARRGMLRLGIEKEFVGGADELTFDYLAEPTDSGQDAVLLVAAQRASLSRIQRMLEAAKLTMAAITPTVLAVDAQLGRPDGSLLYLGEDGIELLGRSRGRTLGLWRIPLGDGPAKEATAASTVQHAIRRALTSVADGQADPADDERSLSLALGSDDESLDGIADDLRSTNAVRELGTLHPAAAVASASLEATGPGIDLGHGKLMEQPARRMPKKWRAAIIAAAFLLVPLVGVGWVWYSLSARLGQLQSDYAQIESEANRLQQIRERTSAVAPWFVDRPAVLECMLTLTRCFPENEATRVTGLRLGEDLAGSAVCRAPSRESMLALVEKMEQSDQLRDVRLRDMNEVGRESTAVSFELSFAYTRSGGERSE